MPKKKQSKAQKKPIHKKVVHTLRPLIMMPWLLVAMFAISTIALSVYVIDQDRSLRQSNILSALTASNASKVPGRACGILTSDAATAYVGEPVSRSFTNTSFPTSVNGERQVWHYDNCYYESELNSTKYVQLFIATHDSDESAIYEIDQYIDLTAIGNAEMLDAVSYDADELYYDSGVYFMRRGDQVVLVAGGNGNPSESRAYVKQVFDDLVSKID